MDMQSFLDDLIKTGREYAEKGQKVAEEQLNIDAAGEHREATLDGMKKGAIAAGALALLLGTKTGRKVTGSAIKIGSLAAVGGIAWKVWQNWQEADRVTPTGLADPKALSVDKLSIDKLEGKEAQERSEILVKAMLAAAKCDGSMGTQETLTINKKIQELGLGSTIEDVFKTSMVTPLSAKSVAKMADNKETATEIYIVSMLVTDTENTQEQHYMNTLAEALGLPAEVVKELESYRN